MLLLFAGQNRADAETRKRIARMGEVRPIASGEARSLTVDGRRDLTTSGQPRGLTATRGPKL